MWHHNVDLLAYHDFEGRSGFKVAMQELEGRFFLYVAGFWHSGWSILDVTDPEHPELLRFLDGPPNTMTIPVQVADGTMVTALEHPNDRHVYLAYFNAGLQIYDISDPHDPHVTGYFIADDPKERRGPIPSKLVHQARDVLIDRRGVIYMSEGNSGIYIPHPSEQLRRTTHMTTPTDIDRIAPVIARHEIDINASLETVWRLQIDVNNWPAWQTDITAARLDGPFEPGNSFTWTSNGFTITSTIYAVAERARTLWGGAVSGIMGTHEWVYTQTRTGIHVATHESWSGQPVQADVSAMQSILDKSLTDWLGHLKAAAENPV